MHKKFYRALEHLLRDIDASAGDEAMLRTVVGHLVGSEEGEVFGIASGRLYRERSLDFVLIESIGEYGQAIEGLSIPKAYASIQHLLERRLWITRPDSPGYDPELESQLSHLNNAAIVVGQFPAYIIAFSIKHDDHEELLVMLEAIRAAIGLKLRQSALEGQLRQAQAIQASLLPQRLPELAGFEFAARSLAADEVGGDVYDLQAVDQGTLGLMIADASGHGLPAALQARDVVVGMRMGQSYNDKITVQVERLNRVVHHTLLTSRFITLFYAEIEDTGNITYVNAGHCPPILMTPEGEAFQLQTSGPVLGPLPDAVYRRCSMTLRPGELLVLVTDGVLERTAPGKESTDEREPVEFGQERLIEVIRRHRNDPAAAVVDAVLAAVDAFGGGAPLEDDMSVMVVRRLAIEGELQQESLIPLDQDRPRSQP